MKADLYTKSVLTVIAVALCAIAFQNVKVISEAQAQDVWPTATPSEVGLDVEALDAFETDIVQGKYGYVDSILVMERWPSSGITSMTTALSMLRRRGPLVHS